MDMQGRGYENLLQDARRQIEGGADLESVLIYMRSQGMSQIECVKAVKAPSQR